MTAAADLERLDPRAARTHEKVLGAARQLLIDEGWDALTHSRLAAESGVSRMTLYRHWPSPIALRRDTLRVVADLEHSTPTGDTRADLLAEMEAIRAHLFVVSRSRLFAAMLDRAQDDPEIRALCDEITDDHCRVLYEILDSAEIGSARTSPAGERMTPVERLLGPCIYRLLVIGRPITAEYVEELVDSYLAEAAHTRI